jgi:hypothetical protein
MIPEIEMGSKVRFITEVRYHSESATGNKEERVDRYFEEKGIAKESPIRLAQSGMRVLYLTSEGEDKKVIKFFLSSLEGEEKTKTALIIQRDLFLYQLIKNQLSLEAAPILNTRLDGTVEQKFIHGNQIQDVLKRGAHLNEIEALYEYMDEINR